jgi:hypothetical protein
MMMIRKELYDDVQQQANLGPSTLLYRLLNVS